MPSHYLSSALPKTQLDQLADAATKATKLATRLDQSKQQLERANKEINSLKEAAQVLNTCTGGDCWWEGGTGGRGCVSC